MAYNQPMYQCTLLDQKEYKRCYENIAKLIHCPWTWQRKRSVQEGIIGNDYAKILWDFMEARHSLNWENFLSYNAMRLTQVERQPAPIPRQKQVRINPYLANCKGRGSNELQGYWLQSFTQLNERTTAHRGECLPQGHVPTRISK